MTAGVGLQVRRAAALPAREEMRRQLMALVLACVLVWYTLVVPPYAGPRRRAADDEGQDGEVRGVGPAAPAVKGDPQPPEELDWPEFIYP